MLDATSQIELIAILPPIWPDWAERLQSHLETMAEGSGGRYLAQDIAERIEGGQFGCYVGREGDDILSCCVFEMAYYPRCTAMRAIGVVGHKFHKWRHFAFIFEEIARQVGCQLGEALVHPGHERIFQWTGGWKMTHQLWEKSLEVIRH